MIYINKGTAIRTLLLLLTYLTLNASTYPSFTQNEILNIEKNLGQSAKKRVTDYTDTINSYKDFSPQQQLVKVNYYLNYILPKADKPSADKENYWETPKEFLTIGAADCEDYAIIKYFTLLKLGFEKEKLFMTAVYEKYTGKGHMVLSYFKEEGAQPLILDNLSFNVVDLKKRKDLNPKMFINESGVYKLDENSKLVKIARGAKQFKELIKRVKKES